jgi:hypothetical protein
VCIVYGHVLKSHIGCILVKLGYINNKGKLQWLLILLEYHVDMNIKKSYLKNITSMYIIERIIPLKH